jgi:hypothetical protein
MDKVLFSLKNGHKLESIPENFTEAELGLLYDLAEISVAPLAYAMGGAYALSLERNGH